MRLALVPLAGIVALALVVLLAGGRPAPTAFERVAAHPERFGGQRVVVTGRVRAIQAPAIRRRAFVLVGPHGRRLLVVTPSRQQPRPRAPGSRATVRGEVIPIEPRADDRAWRDDIVALGDLADRVGARAIIQSRG